MSGQPQGLFDVTAVKITEIAAPGLPPTLPPAYILDKGDPFEVSADFNFNPTVADPLAQLIYLIIQFLQCTMSFDVKYTIQYTAQNMAGPDFISLGSVTNPLKCSGAALQNSYSYTETKLSVPGGITVNGVFKVVATVTFILPGILGFAETTIQVHEMAQIP
jgi:hypothetical protein